MITKANVLAGYTATTVATTGYFDVGSSIGAQGLVQGDPDSNKLVYPVITGPSVLGGFSQVVGPKSLAVYFGTGEVDGAGNRVVGNFGFTVTYNRSSGGSFTPIASATLDAVALRAIRLLAAFLNTYPTIAPALTAYLPNGTPLNIARDTVLTKLT